MANTITINRGETLQNLMEKYSNVSLRKIAAATVEMSKADPTFKSINYGILLKKSKEPIVGEAYDPNATNWIALEEKLIEKGYEPADMFSLNWDAMNEAGSRGHTATLSKSIDDFAVGCKVYLRKNNEVPYEVLYKTDTHIVIMLVGSSEPQAWAHNTFFLNGPSFEPRATTVVEEA